MNQSNNWNIFQKLGFQFIFTYFCLFIFPFVIGYIPGMNVITSPYYMAKRNLIVWVGEHILNVGKITIFPRGSGDTTYNYVEIFTYICIAILVSLIWFIIDRKRPNYQKLLRYFAIYVSYYVASVMLMYGFQKVFCLQFSTPSLLRLVQPYGDSSPMGIAWTFMGSSETYTMFSGYAEVIGGLLLLYRRTRLAGAILVFAVMFNVFMMNMSYDIPVKLASLRYTLMALFIMLLYYKRILNLFILKKPFKIEPIIQSYFKNRKLSVAVTVVKVLFLGYVFYNAFNYNWKYYKQRKNTPNPVLYGIYDVDTFIKNKDTIAPLTTDEVRWKRIIFRKFRDIAYIRDMKDSKYTLYNYTLDSIKKNIKMVNRADSTDILDLNYLKTNGKLIFEGLSNQDSLKVEAKEFDLKSFRLTNRGFRWINETPYNR